MSIQLRPITRDECQLIVNWNIDKDKDYLYQWAGPLTYQFPITAEQIGNRLNDISIIIYLILLDNNPIGSIELFIKDNQAARICRFIMSGESKGRGFGSAALQKLTELAFWNYKINNFDLAVYVYNISAIRCYEKVGFKISEYFQDEDAKSGRYIMTLCI